MSKQQDWFRDQKWGVFTHYLGHMQNNTNREISMGRHTSWNECVNELDVRRMAEEIESIGAHYLIFTTMQGHEPMCAPNATFDRITGYRPGEACAERDLIEELYDALAPRGISLLLYYTGDGPHLDRKAGEALGFYDPENCVEKTSDIANEKFLTNWSDVLREWSVRYGEKIKGWWVDGCYDFFGYTDEKLTRFADAMRAGNPDALMAFNGGCHPWIEKYGNVGNYTCGELNSFCTLPEERFIDGVQWHALAPLGQPRKFGLGSYGAIGCQHCATYMRDYVERATAVGGVVTVDIALYRDGHIDPAQLETLKILQGI